MTMTDPISDLLTRIRNGQMVRKPKIACPASKIKAAIFKVLHEEGYIFHCITSLSTDYYAGKLRQQNLEKLFGYGVFEKIVCLDCGQDKEEGLSPYIDSGCLWIEDKPKNAELGVEYGLRSVLIEHLFNTDYSNPQVQKVKNWKEIYESIV